MPGPIVELDVLLDGNIFLYNQ